MANWLAIGGGALLVLIVLRDTFETIVLPRRVTQRVRLTRIFYHLTWSPGAAAARRWRPGTRREQFLSLYGPLSVLALLVIWALLLILGFALLHWGFGSRVQRAGSQRQLLDRSLSQRHDLLHTRHRRRDADGQRRPRHHRPGSGRGLRRAGAGDRLHADPLSSFRAPRAERLDAGRLGRLAAQRARAAAPAGAGRERRAIVSFLKDWEEWSAFVLESHLSYPSAGLLPLAAREPVVADGADRHSGCLRDHVDAAGRHAPLAGATDLRHGAACRAGSRSPVGRGSAARCPRSPAAGRSRPAAGGTQRRGLPTAPQPRSRRANHAGCARSTNPTCTAWPVGCCPLPAWFPADDTRTTRDGRSRLVDAGLGVVGYTQVARVGSIPHPPPPLPRGEGAQSQLGRSCSPSPRGRGGPGGEVTSHAQLPGRRARPADRHG